MESKYFPEAGATNLPPMKSSYRGFSFGSAVSGAGSYSHRSPKISSGAGRPLERVAGRVFFFAEVKVGMDELSFEGAALVAHGRRRTAPYDLIGLSRFTKVIRRLVSAGLFLLDLAKEVVEQRGGAETVSGVVQPLVAQRFLHRNEELQGLLGSADATGGLHCDRNAGIQVE